MVPDFFDRIALGERCVTWEPRDRYAAMAARERGAAGVAVRRGPRYARRISDSTSIGRRDLLRGALVIPLATSPSPTQYSPAAP